MELDWQKNWLDLYKVLEINRDAGQREIKKAFRSLSKKYHPDAYANKTIEEQEKAAENFRKIIYAYHILGDKKEKNSYDICYDNREEKTAEFSEKEQDFDYEEATKEYTEAEKRAAERISVMQNIKEELENASIYLDNKNNLLLQAYTGEIDEATYFLEAKKLHQLVSFYIQDLEKWSMIAFEYGLFQEIESIDEVIPFVQNEFKSFPKNILEITKEITKELIENQLREDLKNENNRINEIMQAMDDFFLNCFEGKITALDFESKKIVLTMQFNIFINDLNCKKEICQKFELKELLSIIVEYVKKVELKKNMLFANFEQAYKIGRNIWIDEEANNNFAEMKKKKNAILRIISLLKRYPKSGLCEKLYNIGECLIIEMRDLEEKEKHLKSRRISKEKIYSEIFMMAKEKEILLSKIKDLNKRLETFLNESVTEEFLDEIMLNLCNEKLPFSLQCEAIELDAHIKELLELEKLFLCDNLVEQEEFKISSLADDLKEMIEKIRMDRENSKKNDSQENEETVNEREVQQEYSQMKEETNFNKDYNIFKEKLAFIKKYKKTKADKDYNHIQISFDAQSMEELKKIILEFYTAKEDLRKSRGQLLFWLICFILDLVSVGLALRSLNYDKDFEILLTYVLFIMDVFLLFRLSDQVTEYLDIRSEYKEKKEKYKEVYKEDKELILKLKKDFI